MSFGPLQVLLIQVKYHFLLTSFFKPDFNYLDYRDYKNILADTKNIYFIVVCLVVFLVLGSICYKYFTGPNNKKKVFLI